MEKLPAKRIESIDLLRGVVMVIMALDHVRDYFHINALTGNDPTNLDTTTPELFFTRFITHYCAPVFVFLAGSSAFLYGSKRTKKDLFKFLSTRGLWLIFVEIVIMNFVWWFDPNYAFINLQVIWAIGLCMVSLSSLVFLPLRALLAIGLLLVLGHNLLDVITYQGQDLKAILWYVLHQGGFVQTQDHFILIMYPILPWIGVIILGYVFGCLYKTGYPVEKRTRMLLWLCISSILLFLIIRIPNLYGDPVPWIEQDNGVFTLLSVLNLTKYPPSLSYLLITLGPAFLFLYLTENISNSITKFFLVFGRVPFFYYVLHVFVIHLAAILGLLISGGNYKIMLPLNPFSPGKDAQDYGYSLFVVYLIWILVVAFLYFPSKRYMEYKMRNRHKWWLSYL
ncbi:DUF1624 domain-containing protein [Pontixanthobacter gangjinensis]|uniref:DUF1624 domain-containing protein n=1 Tax=Christiangramia aestuarii TaxID=1028746 RepID=A0A7K1LMR2_9FLAO|nr:heparan-alpha-glucosaminide N-acetyltransferase domain-containing protein [Christiangramia aestuarii]MUP42077.1 DUF1624 domain-containing protein [Christiangramia aestuarii]